MKIFFVLLFILVSGIGPASGWEERRGASLYTFFINVAGDRFYFPLVGFVNVAEGNQFLPQIGTINLNGNNFSSFQTGVVNVTGGDFSGLQMGTINTVAGDLRGAQISIVNTAGRLSGLQLGFINYADTVEEGVPIGFISVVRNGGYRALEFSVSGTMPAALSFKLGVSKIYTSINLAYRPAKGAAGRNFLTGFGAGSIIDINEMFFINPELTFMSELMCPSRFYIGFVPSAGYHITPRVGILIGPLMTWAYGEIDRNPFMNFMSRDIDDSNTLFFGGKLSLRFRF